MEPIFVSGVISSPPTHSPVRLEHLKTDLRGVLIRRESGNHLLVRMNVVPKISQPVTELFHIGFQQADFTRNIYELSEAPVMESLHATMSSFRGS